MKNNYIEYHSYSLFDITSYLIPVGKKWKRKAIIELADNEVNVIVEDANQIDINKNIINKCSLNYVLGVQNKQYLLLSILKKIEFLIIMVPKVRIELTAGPYQGSVLPLNYIGI